MVGGPATAPSTPVPGTVTVTRESSAGAPADTCTATAGTDGTFSFILAPGRYRFTGRSPQFDGGRVDCVGDSGVVIPAPSGNGVIANGPNMSVNVDCQRA